MKSPALLAKSRRLATLAALLVLGFAGSPLRAADAPAGVERGRTLYQQACSLCHAAGPGTAPGSGPTLLGVVGRRAASLPNYAFSPALTASGLTWNAATLDRYIANPTAAVPGTSMVVQVGPEADRRDIIAFLATLTAPAAPAATAAPAAPGAGRGGGRGVNPNASDPNDWRQNRPGRSYTISSDRLAAPYTSVGSARSGIVPQPTDARLEVPAGFKVELFARGLTNPRIVQVAPNGDIFVAETGANRLHVYRAADGAATPTSDQIFATGLSRPFGIAFHPSGAEPQWIYVANNNSVVRFPYRNGDLQARGPAETIVAELSPTSGGHTTRDLAFSKDGRRLFISVGSAGNLGQGMTPKSAAELAQWEAENGLGAAWGGDVRRANILVTSPDGREPVKIFATGIRNPVGLAVEPVTGNLWTSTNERDGLGDDLVPDYVTSVKEGGFYGWPWYYLGNHEDPRVAGARPDLAGKATVPDVPIQAHSAPLGMAFYTATTGASVFPAEYRGDLFVALHGSWNRTSLTGYKVVRAKLQNGRPTGEYIDFLTGFVFAGPTVWGRPVGVAVARDGALLITDDGAGTIWRVSTTR